MTKLFAPRAALCLALATLAGCELYLGDGGDYDDDDRWTYCANDGYYVCDGSDCEWAGARCPEEPGYSCTSDAECAAGCYCGDEGVCEEAGFCNSDEQCADGFTCDEERASCVPSACASDADCDQGEYCDGEGSCVSSCTCTTDQEAIDAGWAFCDEARNTCEPAPAGGSCQGLSTCNIAEPSCAAGSVPLVENGCYTGTCSEISACDLTPECEKLQAEGDCLSRTGACTSVYIGLNCTNPQGDTCVSGSTNCTCSDFQFADCRTATTANAAPFSYLGANGELIDMFSRN